MGIPSVSKSIEIATSNEAINVASFCELFQLPVDEELTPTQLSSSLLKPKTKTTPIQGADNELEKRSIVALVMPSYFLTELKQGQTVDI